MHGRREDAREEAAGRTFDLGELGSLDDSIGSVDSKKTLQRVESLEVGEEKRGGSDASSESSALRYFSYDTTMKRAETDRTLNNDTLT